MAGVHQEAPGMPVDERQIRTKVVVCLCALSGTLPQDVVRVVRREMAGAPCTWVDDLCGVAARRPERLRDAAGQARLVVAACRPRAVGALLARAGVERGPQGLRVLDLRNSRPEEAVAELERECASASGGPQCLDADEGTWIPWYPVIDAARCKACRQCLGFCLFGVYTEAAGRVAVAHPQRCKTNCPACARICPEAALIFPKCGEPPIDGSEIREEDVSRRRGRAGIDELLGDDARAALAARRHRARQSLVDRRRIAQALAERDGHAREQQ